MEICELRADGTGAVVTNVPSDDDSLTTRERIEHLRREERALLFDRAGLSAFAAWRRLADVCLQLDPDAGCTAKDLESLAKTEFGARAAKLYAVPPPTLTFSW